MNEFRYKRLIKEFSEQLKRPLTEEELTFLRWLVEREEEKSIQKN